MIDPSTLQIKKTRAGHFVFTYRSVDSLDKDPIYTSETLRDRAAAAWHLTNLLDEIGQIGPEFTATELLDQVEHEPAQSMSFTTPRDSADYWELSNQLLHLGFSLLYDPRRDIWIVEAEEGELFNKYPSLKEIDVDFYTPE